MVQSTPELHISALRGASERPNYNTAAVVRLSGVSAATFRAWERRYGLPRPQRLPGGQRLYSDRDVAAIRWLHDQTRRGLTISRAVALLREALAASERSPASAQAGRPLSELAGEMLASLLVSDHARAEATLAEAFALHPAERVLLELVQPMLVEVGERWHRDELSVAEEHLATQFVLRKLLVLYGAYDTGPGRPVIVTACGPDEWHEVGILIVTLFLARRGYRVLYLGPNLPLDELHGQVERLRPALVCISATMAETAEALLRQAPSFLEACGERTTLGFGGRAFQDPVIAARAPAQLMGADAAEAADIVDRTLGTR